MKKQKYIIAGGNSTLLVWSCPLRCKKQVINKYLGEVEQIGFVTTKKNFPFLQMMGNELSINSTFAFASQLEPQGFLYTSGITKIVNYQNTKDGTSITLNLPYKKKKTCIIFEGIGYYVSSKKISDLKPFLKKLCKKYTVPAFGLALVSKNRLIPYIYVKGTDSLIKETACGSGSIATSIITGYSKIIQPTGKIISVMQEKDKFTITAKVDKI